MNNAKDVVNMVGNDLIARSGNKDFGYVATRDVILQIAYALKEVPKKQRQAYLDSLIDACMEWNPYSTEYSDEERDWDLERRDRDDRFLGK